MKKTTLFYLRAMFEDFVCHLVDIYDRLFSKKPTPSYLAYNVVWFTNCSWLEQLESFKQLDLYLDKDKTHV